MRPLSFRSDELRSLLLRTKIATLDELKQALGTSVDVTVFRKLKPLDYLTSYSHRGRYYTLREIARFDDKGLWSQADGLVLAIRHACCQRRSHLSIVPRAGISPMNLLVPCTSMCRTRCINWLSNAGSPARSFRVCICTRPSTAQSSKGNFLTRRNVEAVPTVVDASVLEVSEEELKASILLFYSLLDEQQRRLYAGLESLKLGRGGDRSLADFLDLDPHTVARGRQQLLAQDVEVDRARKTGGGRKRVEKKRPK